MCKYELVTNKFRKRLKKVISKALRKTLKNKNLISFDYTVYKNGILSFDCISRSNFRGIQVDYNIKIKDNTLDIGQTYNFFKDNISKNILRFLKSDCSKEISVENIFDGFAIRGIFSNNENLIDKINFHIIKENSKIDVDFIHYDKNKKLYSYEKYNITHQYMDVKILQFHFEKKSKNVKELFLSEMNNNCDNNIEQRDIIKKIVLNHEKF